jgi:hypothetical protein
MAVINAPKLFLGKYDLSGYANQFEPTVDVEMKNPTTFADGLTQRAEFGFETVRASGKVIWRADSAAFKSHDILRSAWNVSDVPLSWSPQGGAVGQMAQFFKALHASYKPAGSVGDLILADFTAIGTGGSPNIYGTVLETGTKTEGGDGAAQELGLLGTGQRIYAVLHIFTIAGGGTLTVKVESDDNSGFTSAVERLAFTGATAAGHQWLELAGAIADDTYWRATWPLSAGTAAFAVHAGIL